MSSLYDLDINSLVDIRFTNIFFLFQNCLFTPLIISFADLSLKLIILRTKEDPRMAQFWIQMFTELYFPVQDSLQLSFIMDIPYFRVSYSLFWEITSLWVVGEGNSNGKNMARTVLLTMGSYSPNFPWNLEVCGVSCHLVFLNSIGKWSIVLELSHLKHWYSKKSDYLWKFWMKLEKGTWQWLVLLTF